MPTSETMNMLYQHNANDYASTLTPPQPSADERVNTDTLHQHEYDDKHTDTTHPSVEYYNEWANTSAGYTTNTPPPARTQHPHANKSSDEHGTPLAHRQRVR
jgi:2,4-dienoyl-CoA reductase-like NADH-dependent reductase (Old Yellow Enzyme family)